MIANIDGDLVAYPCAASCKEEDPLDVALFRCDKLIREILEASDCEQYNIFLSTKSNFRYKINPEYKANRKDTEPPQWLQQCKEYLITEWHAKVKENYEADDLLGINQRDVYGLNQGDSTVLCSFDKDLLMIPGLHFNWKKQQYGDCTHITKEEGIQHFYVQMLVGDTTDNVIGITGLGPVKSKKYLSSAQNEQDLFDLVYDKYNDPERFLMNGICLWICQKEGETWAQHLKNSELIIPNELQPVLEQKLKFMKSFMETI